MRFCTKGFVALVLVALSVLTPAAVFAGEPIPPKNIFHWSATSTPAPLPTPTPMPTREIESAAIPAPDDEGAPAVYLPFVALQPLLTNTEPADIGVSNPMVDSFVYEVKPGDTLSGLAMEFGRDVKTMACVRTEDRASVKMLHPGQHIIIPALSDLCHTVKSGETLQKIAAWYGVTPETLIAVPENHLTGNGSIHQGQTILIPHARSRYQSPAAENLPRPQRDGWRYGDGEFVWPLPRGSFWISQRFKHGKHMAVDLAAAAGTPVYAADTGRVVKAGWSDIGYGYRIIIDHGIDYVTLYAHLSEYFVQPGDIVQKGEIIGRVGSTGNSTGPHLHFEVRDYGYLIDPLLVLPK